MRYFNMVLGFLIPFCFTKAQDTGYSRYPVYSGTGLGATWTPESTTFRIWAPTASAAEIILYDAGKGGNELRRLPMKMAEQGTWLVKAEQDLNGRYYTVRVKISGQWSPEVTDPYARAAGINGKRGMVLDLSATDPPGWAEDKSPPDLSPVESIIYELHVRDASISSTSGIRNKGKFLGLAETGTKNNAGLSTGLDHLKELGITHVHLLPVYDFNSIDESAPGKSYNWGYDPLNYNIPEGSYASDAANGYTRIREMKQLIRTLHEHGIRVVMDVVYNHTALTETSNFNQLVPGYYYRQTPDGKFSNATACGNETASERPMFRKFMVESMKYWVEEYHIDGFRIDLMGVHDIETMNQISATLNQIRPGILLYGEGWTAGESPLPDSLRALKANVSRLKGIAVFGDDLRDGIKGSVFKHEDRGFASGKPGMEESVKFGIIAACPHPGVSYDKVNYSKAPFATSPLQTISYTECHDNHVLYDKLVLSAPSVTETDRENMYRLALTIVLTSQGISFLHAGTEMMRTKKGVENSYESPDSINAIDWDQKTKHRLLFDYIRSLVKMRKEHPAFRLKTGPEVSKHIRFMDNLPAGVIGYLIDGAAAGDNWKKIMVLFNGSSEAREVTWPEADWKIFLPGVEEKQPGTGMPSSSGMRLKPFSSVIAHQ